MTSWITGALFRVSFVCIVQAHPMNTLDKSCRRLVRVLELSCVAPPVWSQAPIAPCSGLAGRDCDSASQVHTSDPDKGRGMTQAMDGVRHTAASAGTASRGRVS